MKKIFCLFGINAENLESANSAIEKCLGIVMRPHESSYHCGDYYRFETQDGITLILQNNYDPFDREYTEEDFKEYKYLLYFSGEENEKNANFSLLKNSIDLELLRTEKL